MKKVYSVFMMLVLLSTVTNAQNIVDSWNGVLSIMGNDLIFVIHIEQLEDGRLDAKMDSPSQETYGIPSSKVSFQNDSLLVEIKAMGAKYIGVYKKDQIIGEFFQRGVGFPLVLSRGKVEKPKRPQMPKEPFMYEIESVTFTNPKAGNIKLSGTLTTPYGIDNPPVAILINGSGPFDRDESLFGHKPFWVIADYLSSNGIAVLRYDERGVGESEGVYVEANSFDLASDAEAALNYLTTRKDKVDISKIGFIGHSEGGYLAPIVAETNKTVAFLVLLAGPGQTGADILTFQRRQEFEKMGLPKAGLDADEEMTKKAFEQMKSGSIPDSLMKEKMIAFYKKEKTTVPPAFQFLYADSNVEGLMTAWTSKWFLGFIKSEPQKHLSKVNCPVLALNGEKDSQVLAVPNIESIKAAQVHNKAFKAVIFPNLNHLFQNCTTGDLKEYAKIEETFSEEVLQLMETWILEVTK